MPATTVAQAIRTGRLELLPLRVEHAEEMAVVLSDPALHAFTGGVPDTEIAWVVGTPWQGRGIATEAVRGLVDWLGRQSLQRVIAHIHPDHQASAAVATAAGLMPTDERHEGEIRWRRTLMR
jgi:hypothetical protein